MLSAYFVFFVISRDRSYEHVMVLLIEGAVSVEICTRDKASYHVFLRLLNRNLCLYLTLSAYSIKRVARNSRNGRVHRRVKAIASMLECYEIFYGAHFLKFSKPILANIY